LTSVARRLACRSAPRATLLSSSLRAVLSSSPPRETSEEKAVVLVSESIDSSQKTRRRTPPPVPHAEEQSAAVLTTSANQAAASDFASSSTGSFGGVGVCFSSNWLRSTSVAEQLGTEPSQENVESAVSMLSSCVIDSMFLGAVGEKAEKTLRGHPRSYLVQQSHLDKIARHYRNTLRTTTTSTNTTFKTLVVGASTSSCIQDYSYGVSTSNSAPGGYFITTLMYTPGDSIDIAGGIAEAKGMAAAPVEALPQAFAESTHVAMAMVRNGVLAKDVVVPIWTTTGQLMKFGITRLLEPSFPYLAAVSKTFDVTDDADLREAAKLLAHIDAWCRTPKQASRSRCEKLAMELSPVLYYPKPLSTFFDVYEAHHSESVRHMLRVLQKALSSEDACKYVEAPITVRTKDKTDKDKARGGDALIFRNLVNDDFQIGVPAEEEQRGRYLNALRAAMNAIHAAGVVHLDFYPSNFMWKEEDGRVIVKIIDWDTAHFVDEALTPATLERMSSLVFRRKLASLGDTPATVAMPAFDSSLLDLLSEVADKPDLHTSDKENLDRVFKAEIEAKASTVN